MITILISSAVILLIIMAYSIVRVNHNVYNRGKDDEEQIKYLEDWNRKKNSKNK